MNEQSENRHELPLGFGMALAQNGVALEQFAALDAPRKDAVIRAAGAVNSKSEMQQLVSDLAEGSLPGGV